jgi:hypothetical protein
MSQNINFCDHMGYVLSLGKSNDGTNTIPTNIYSTNIIYNSAVEIAVWLIIIL